MAFRNMVFLIIIIDTIFISCNPGVKQPIFCNAPQLKIEHKGLYEQDEKLYGVFQRKALNKIIWWFVVQIHSLDGPWPNVSKPQKALKNDEFKYKHFLPADEDVKTAVGYEYQNQKIVFDATYALFLAPPEKQTDELEPRSVFYFGAVNHVWLSCPPPLCLDATIDGAEYSASNGVMFFRGQWLYLKTTGFEMKHAKKIREYYPGVEEFVDAVLYDSIAEHIYKDGKVHLYISDSGRLESIIDSTESPSSFGFNQVTNSQGDKQWYHSIPIERLNLTLAIDAAFYAKVNSTTKYIIYMNSTHYLRTDLKDIWAKILEHSMMEKCSEGRTDKICETVEPLRESSYERKVKEIEDIATGIVNISDAFFHYENQAYYFIDKWEYVIIDEESFLTSFKGEKNITEPNRTYIMDKEVNCPVNIYSNLNQENMSLYVTSMYEKMDSYKPVYKSLDIKKITERASLLLIILAVFAILIILAGGGTCLCVYAPNENMDEFHKRSTNASAAENTGAAITGSSSLEEESDSLSKEGNKAKEILGQLNKNK